MTVLEKRNLVEEYLGKQDSLHSAYSFINIYAWEPFFKFEFKIIDDSLCVFAKNELGVFLYLPPLGQTFSLSTIEKCFQIMEDMNRGSNVSRIENVSHTLVEMLPNDRYHFTKKDYEFCYYKNDIIHFKGNDYKSKRSSYNQFVRNYNSAYLPYTTDMLNQCMDLYEQWADDRLEKSNDDIYCHLIEENKTVHEHILKHYKELHLLGRVVLIDGKVKAYTFGYPVNKEMFCVLFEIADLSLQGLSTFIFNRFCADEENAPYRFINVMDDFGMENVKKTKESFRPSLLIPSYTISQKEC